MKVESIRIQSPNHLHSAEILPTYGGTLSSLKLQGIEVIQFPLKKAKSWKDGFPSSILFPFPNRTDGGKYTHLAQEYQLPINEESRGHAIHGVVADKPFDVLKSTENQVTLAYSLNEKESGYPFQCTLELDYLLNNEGLVFSFTIISLAKSIIPVAFGWHPYFRLGEGNIDTLCIEMPKVQEVQVNSVHIPIGHLPMQERHIRSLNGVVLDTAYLIKEEGWVSTKLMSTEHTLTISQWSSSPDMGLNYLVIYTPDTRDCIAIEPQTANINALNNKEGLLYLNPMERTHGKMKVGLQTS